MEVWGITDRGVVRSQNQDAYAIREYGPDRVLAVVCDGMGGARAGNVASTMTVDIFFDAFEKGTGEDLQRMQQAALRANDLVFQRAVTDEDCVGMGTTLVAVMISGEQASVLNVGDSRAYRINEHGIAQITRDHSLVEDLVTSGQLSREEARNHPKKNLITRALGCEPQLRVDQFNLAIAPGDRFLLCSDGLSNVVTDQEMLYEVLHGGEEASCCRRLLEVALHRGAPDNVTVVLLCCGQIEHEG